MATFRANIEGAMKEGKAMEFEYEDPVDGSVTKHQGYILDHAE